MNALVPAGSDRLERRLEAVLTSAERLRMALDLGSAALAGGLLLVAFLFQWFGDPAQRPLVELFKAVAALIVSAPVFAAAVRGVITGNADDVLEQLVALAVLAALASGEFATAALVPMILNLGHFLEQRSVLGAQAAIDGLRTLHGRTATLLTDEGEREVEPTALRPGDVVVVRPGDVLPADGIIRKGISMVDQSSITGESLAEEVGLGMSLFAGSINLTGLLEVTVTGVGEKTALGRVLELLRSAEQSKTPAVRLLEQYATFYVPIMLMAAAVLLFVTRDMSRAVTLLVVACPGAFVLAGPTAMIAALAAASRLGILVKNTKFLEVLADVDTVVLDKTGTVTLGHLEVVAIRLSAGAEEEELLRAAALCGGGSRHPASRAVMRAAATAGLAPVEVPESVAETPGRGVVAAAKDGDCLLGRGDWLRERGLDVPGNPEHAGPVVWVARNGRVLGCLLLADLPRPEAARAVRELRELGLSRVVLLTGDRQQAAVEVARTLDIEHVVAEVLPEQKLQTVQAEKAAGRSVMVVGDGVNDALALASGDVGVAMGAMGSDVALQSADVALMTNDLARLPLAIRLSRETRAIINQNLLIGAGSSVVMLTLAALGLVSPIVGAVLHNAGEIYVLFNSARLLGFGRISGVSGTLDK
jgi:heavy metal translocating P-type ATPase